MITALLVLIALILLFGAGVVKGWIFNTLTFGAGAIAIFLALLWVGSYFGEHGFTYIVLGLGAALFILRVCWQPDLDD